MKLINAFLVFGVDAPQASSFMNTQFEGESLTLPGTPKLLEHYPTAPSDEERYLKLHVFALPQGVTAFQKQQTEEIVHFVATDLSGTKTYCTCFRVCERLSKKREVYVFKSLVLTSSNPMYTLHRQFLEHIRELICRAPQYRRYQERMKYRADYRELLLSALFNGLPTHHIPDVLVSHYPSLTFDGRRTSAEPFLRYRKPSIFRLPNYPFHLLLMKLRPENVIDVLHCLMLELRVVLVSTEVSELGPVAEALLALLYPLKWRHIYVPFLPSQLHAYLDAPVPFLMGVQKGVELRYEDQVIVDLDCSQVSVPSQLPSLPAPYATQLYKTLLEIVHTADLEKTQEGWLAASLHTQRAALTYFIQVLGSFDTYLTINNGFDGKGFLESKDAFSRQFYENLTRTQLWMQLLDASRTREKEIHEFVAYRDRFRVMNFAVFRLEMQREVEKVLQEYRNPLRVGLEDLFNIYRPEPSSPTPAPITARQDSEVSFIQPPSDRFICGNYWQPLNPGYFIDFFEAPGKVAQPTNDSEEQFLVKNLDTDEYVFLPLKCCNLHYST